MLFNSLEFAIFLPLVFSIYWFILNEKLRLQNLLLLLASYFFYGWWDWRFLTLIFFSTCVDYVVGLNLGKDIAQKKRKYLIQISLIVNIGLLFIFKYFNFFSESFAEAFSLLGVALDPARLNIILPIGISFYTFQTLSYSIDIYKNKLKPTTDFIEFATFVSFFPQLVAGPIERASNLLPQFQRRRKFEYDKAVDGMRQILLGLFKKIVIADNCAEFANLIFNNSADYSGSTLLLGAMFFTFQVYGDFSGYSDIAIGTARLFGFNLMQNFAFPYFSSNITEFYRRWHISLSTWIRDYIYAPLSFKFRKVNKNYNYIIVFLITFTLFGFWHGANWTFIVFGIIQGIILSFEYRTRKLKRKFQSKSNDTLYYLFSVLITYGAWCFSCIFFRAETLGHAVSYINSIFSFNLFSFPSIPGYNKMVFKTILLIIVFLIVEWFQKEKQHALQFEYGTLSKGVRWNLYIVMIVLILFSYKTVAPDFIYFQF